MMYETIPVLSREQVQAALSGGNAETVATALLSTALYGSDPKWSEAQCIACLDFPRTDVKAAALIGLSHLARLHKHLDLSVLLPKLSLLESLGGLSGQIADLRDDIGVFVAGAPSS